MKNDYVIRRPTRADEPKIEVLAQEIWPGASEGKLSRRWWWNAEVPHCWVAEHGPSGDIAAICGERRARLWAKGRELSSAAICDWDVSPRHGRKGLGRALVERSQSENALMYTTSISEAAAVGFERLGWTGHTVLPIAFATPPVVWAAAKAQASRAFEVDVSNVSSDDPSALAALDELGARVDSQPSVLMLARDRAALTEHLSLVPGRRYRLAVAREAGEVVAYVLYRTLPKGSFRRFRHAPIGFLADFFTREGKSAALVPLIGAAAGELTRRGVPVMMALGTLPEHRRTLTRLGMVSAEVPLVGKYLRSLGSRAMVAYPEPVPAFLDGWHLTFLDNDMDLIFGSEAGA